MSSQVLTDRALLRCTWLLRSAHWAVWGTAAFSSVGGLSWLLVTGVPWPPFSAHPDLLVGKDTILTITHLLPKAREGVLLHKYRLEGAYKCMLRP